MKLLLKLSVVAFTAKTLVANPRGANKHLDRVGDMTVRQVAQEVDSAFTQLQKKVSRLMK
jgi:hypothetical protein